MKYNKIQAVDNFKNFVGDWNSLVSNSGTNFPFVTREWLSAWWDSFGVGRKLFILAAVNDKRELQGLAPLMISKNKANIRLIEFIGTKHSDYLDFIYTNIEADLLRDLFSVLSSEDHRYDLIFLSDVLADDEKITRMNQAASSVGLLSQYRQYEVSPYLDLSGTWSDFLSSKSRNFRYNLKRKEKRLEKEGLKLDIRLIQGSDFDIDLFDKLVSIERNCWKYNAGSAKMQEDRERNFYLNFLNEFAEKNWLNIWLACINEEPAAYLINFDYAEKIWFYNAAYHNEYQKYGIGTILTKYAVCDAFEKGKKEYDFLRGDEEYKDQWATNYRESFQLVYYKKNLISIVGYLIFFKLRWFLARSSKLKRIRLYLKMLKQKHKIKI